MKNNVLPLALSSLPYVISIEYQRPVFKSMKWISSYQDSYRAIKQYLNDENLDYKEKMWVMVLTRSHRLLSISLLSTGGTYHTECPIKEILQTCLLTNACAIIIVHNHPSGSLKFSNADVDLTEKIVDVLKLINVHLLDHLVITTEGFSSFSEEHFMKI